MSLSARANRSKKEGRRHAVPNGSLLGRGVQVSVRGGAHRAHAELEKRGASFRNEKRVPSSFFVSQLGRSQVFHLQHEHNRTPIFFKVAVNIK